MSQYSMTPAQKAYLKKKYARETANKPCCHCPGCERCNGFIVGCACDEENIHDILARNRHERRQPPRDTDS